MSKNSAAREAKIEHCVKTLLRAVRSTSFVSCSEPKPPIIMSPNLPNGCASGGDKAIAKESSLRYLWWIRGLVCSCLFILIWALYDITTITYPVIEPREYIMWSKEEAYFAHCRKNIIGNREWGRPLAPLVDKIDSKIYARQWSPSVQIVPTLAIFDAHNISLLTHDFLKTLPQPFVIKPSHISGLALGVAADELTCLKGCNSNGQHNFRNASGRIEDPFVLSSMIDILQLKMNSDFSEMHGEMQYHFIPPRIILEKNLPMKEMRDVTYWYLARGKPVLVSMQCAIGSTERRKERILLTADYQRLPVSLKSPPCVGIPTKPKTWERMREIAEIEFGPKLQGRGVVRLDLYAGETDVYFSELTFTSSACNSDFWPRVADGLLHAIDHGLIPITSITPNFVRDTILDASWVHVSVSSSRDVQMTSSSDYTFPSPVDLCLAMHHENYEDCVNTLKTIAHDSIRCIVSAEDNHLHEMSLANTTSVHYHAFGVPSTPTLASVWGRVPQDKILLLLTLFCLTCLATTKGSNTKTIKSSIQVHDEEEHAINLLHHHRIKKKRMHHRQLPPSSSPHQTTTNKYKHFRNNVVFYHSALAFYMFLTSKNDGMISANSTVDLIRQSFFAFQNVHPISSPLIIVSHVGTYWLMVYAWTAPSVKSLLFRQLLAELIPPFVNEYTHHTETQNNIRCLRIAFIDAVQNHVVDELIRGYFLQPFFVYFYLLPKFIMHHIGLLALTGDTFTAVFICHLVFLSCLCGIWLHKQSRMTVPSRSLILAAKAQELKAKRPRGAMVRRVLYGSIVAGLIVSCGIFGYTLGVLLASDRPILASDWPQKP